MGNVLLYDLFGLGLVCALLCGFGRRLLWFPLSVLSAIGGVLTGLALGYDLETLLLPLVLLTGASLLPLLGKEGGQ